MRSSAPRQVGVNCMMNHEPWQRVGLSSKASAAAEWKRFQLTFIAEVDEPSARVSFSSSSRGCTSFRAFPSGRGIVGLPPRERLEDATVAVVRGNINVTAAAKSDFVDFLWDTGAATTGGDAPIP